MTGDPGTTDSVADRALALSVAIERLRARWRRELGISAYEMLAIVHLAADGPLTIGSLGARLALSSGAMTGLVDRLESTGRVMRVRDERDRRRVHLAVTDTMRARLDELEGPLRRRIEDAGLATLSGAALLDALHACYEATIEELG